MHETHEHHDHPHTHQQVTPQALLRHMVEHNRSHVEELKHIAEALPAETAAEVLKAAEAISAGNEQLAAVAAKMEA